jgi:hypothetical protein
LTVRTAPGSVARGLLKPSVLANKVAGAVEQTAPAYFLAGLEGREQQTEPGAYLVNLSGGLA